MCYSAQLQAAYMRYLRETGAEMDIDQFVEIFGARVADSSIRIPRAVERWFDEPKNDAERRIKAFIDEYRARRPPSSNARCSRRRSDWPMPSARWHPRPPRPRPRASASPTDKIDKALTRLERLRATKPHPAEARIFPLHYAPIVMQDGDKRLMRLARYHCRKPGEVAFIDRKLPGLYNARRDSLGKYWKELFGVSHAVMLVESFFENVEREGKNQVLHFVPKPAGTMLIACLVAQWKDPKGGAPLLSFAAITDEPPAEVAAAGHDRMIINLKPEHVDAWLRPEGRSLDELQQILGDRQAPYYEHEVMAA